MKKTVIAVASVLSMAFTIPAFAVEGSQTTQQTAPDFERIKADHLKRLDERITSLQQQKTCVQAAKTQDALGACWSQHKAETKWGRDEMKKQRDPGTKVSP